MMNSGFFVYLLHAECQIVINNCLLINGCLFIASVKVFVVFMNCYDRGRGKILVLYFLNPENSSFPACVLYIFVK